MSTTLVNLTGVPLVIKDYKGYLQTFAPAPFTPSYQINRFTNSRPVPYVTGFQARSVKSVTISNFPPEIAGSAYIVPLSILALYLDTRRSDIFSPDYEFNTFIAPDGVTTVVTQLLSLSNKGLIEYPYNQVDMGPGEVNRIPKGHNRLDNY